MASKSARAAPTVVDTHRPEYLDDVFRSGSQLKLLSDDPSFARPQQNETLLVYYNGFHVVVKSEALIAKHAQGVAARLAQLVKVAPRDTLLQPLAYSVSRGTGEMRLVLPCVASEHTVCLDLVQFLFPTGPTGGPITITADELSLFVLDMIDALSTLHAAGITTSAVEPNNILVEFEAATHSTPRRVVRFLLADYRRSRVYPVDDAPRGYPHSAFIPPSPDRSTVGSTLSLPHDAYQLGLCMLWLMFPSNADLRARPYTVGDTRLINDPEFTELEYDANLGELAAAIDHKACGKANVAIMKQLLKSPVIDFSGVRDALMGK